MEAPRNYAVVLTPDQRQGLEDLSRNGLAPAKKLLHARIQLVSDQPCAPVPGPADRDGPAVARGGEGLGAEAQRGRQPGRVQVTTQDTRIKLRHLYPHI